jgi:hypothetical protein
MSRHLPAAVVLLLLGCSAPEPAPAPGPPPAPAPSPALEPAASEPLAPDAEERVHAEALASVLVAAFDQVERAFSRGEVDNEPLLAAVGDASRSTWAMSGTDVVESPRQPGQPEDPAWTPVVRVLGSPDRTCRLEAHRLEAGFYRSDLGANAIRNEPGVVLFRVLEVAPGRATHDTVVDRDGTERVVATQQVHRIATAGVFVPYAQLHDLLARHGATDSPR